jgi:predicted metalloprotease with PDZ domain
MIKSFLLLTLSVITAGAIHAKRHLPQSGETVNVSIDLVKVKSDKVKVTIETPAFTSSTATFMIPKTVPGTYSEDDYGRYIEQLIAFDAAGAKLAVSKVDANTYTIQNATTLKKITYLVNDTYDTEVGDGFGHSDIFSPAGSNILAGKQFMLNTHAFVGYFKGYEQTPYRLTVLHSKKIEGFSAMEDGDPSPTVDLFEMPSYAKLVEMPLMYNAPNATSFTIDGMEIIISVYSPSGKYPVSALAPSMEKVMRAQKNFLGSFNSTKKYAVLIYLTNNSPKAKDAKGIGALEHPTSTTVVMPESMDLEQLDEMLKDVVSHEFFHIVTPLTIHAEQIHNFDFNDPEMSEHLWMYEGVTEYFANLFQITEGLITEEEFFGRMSGKIASSYQMNDSLSFTLMSKNVLDPKFKEQYMNVYQKGALIAMCIDIIIREESGGEKGILHMMQDLAAEYGSGRAFKDDELFPKIVSLTYPSVGEFLKKHVAGDTPIPYEAFFKRMGVEKTMIEKSGNPFIGGIYSGKIVPFISVNANTEIFMLPVENVFMEKLGVKGGDIILEINGTKYNYDNINSMIETSLGWEDGDAITLKVKRGDKVIPLTGKVTLPKEQAEGYAATSDNTKKDIRNAWLKGGL